MKAKIILEQLCHLKSVYGISARLFKDDDIKAVQFLKEIFEQIIQHPAEMETAFGFSIVAQINAYFVLKIID